MKVDGRTDLPKEDQLLFNSMVGNYQSENEKVFFETLKELEQTDFSVSHDILLEDTENEDHLYFIRIGYFEYMFGYVYNDKQ